MAKYWATADPRAVRVYRDGLVVAYRRGDYSGTKAESPNASAYTPPGGRAPAGGGVNADEVDATVEEMGYVAASSGSWKWVEAQGYYRFSVAPEAAWRARQPAPPPDLTYEQMVRTFGTPEKWVRRWPGGNSDPGRLLPKTPGRYRDEVAALRRQGW